MSPRLACVCALGLLAVANSAVPSFGQTAPAYVSAYLKDPTSLATRDASKKCPRTFVVSDQIAPSVMGKARALISGWKEPKNTLRGVMKIQNVTDDMVDTYEPYELSQFGFNVTSVKTTKGREITIEGKAYEGNPFAISGEHKEATKRAELLSFLLQEYVKEISSEPGVNAAPALATVPVAPAVADGKKLRPEIEALLMSVRTLLEAGQTEAAVSQLDTLKQLLQKQSAAPTAPTSPEAEAVAQTPKKP